ncbi:MAG: PHP domain-containing protein [Bacteroidales bacterium]|nr:PHP domain-containing protein [Bacteroidales bacterium]
MQTYSADLHVHTLLSPCGDLEMSPARIVEEAVRQKIGILGITDHNSTKHAALIRNMAAKHDIFVLCGAEVTTKEEIHCLTFFENDEKLMLFQQYLDQHLSKVPNKPHLFGYQVVLDESEMIVEEVETLLIAAINQSVDEVEEKVHNLGGLFIPAHIDRPAYSFFSQLGFVPPGIKADALEVSRQGSPEELISQFPYLAEYSFIRSSDAHHPAQIGVRTTTFELETRSFSEISMALKGISNRRVIV